MVVAAESAKSYLSGIVVMGVTLLYMASSFSRLWNHYDNDNNNDNIDEEQRVLLAVDE